MTDPSQIQFPGSHLEFQISPSIGFANNSIKLGISLNNLLSSLSATQIKFVYSSSQPLSTPYTISLSKFDINLVINQSSQRLIFIELNDFTKKDVKYSFNGKQLKSFDLKEVYNVLFGPTYNGQIVNGYFILSYPGISFKFAIPADIDTAGETGVVDEGEVFNKLFLKNPKIQSIVIHSFRHYSQIKNNSNVINLSTNPNPIELEKLIIKDKVITFKFLKHRQNLKTCELVLHKSDLQDVLMLIGPPDEIFNKDETRQKIHSMDSSSTHITEVVESEFSLVFHNYYSFGLDLLYENNTLIKLIIHNNSPLNKLNFGKYEKCQFEIVVPPQEQTAEFDDDDDDDDDYELQQEEQSDQIVHNDLYFNDVFDILKMDENKIKPILINRSNYSNSRIELINHEYDEEATHENGNGNGNGKDNGIGGNNGKLEFQSLVYVNHVKDEIWEVVDNCLDSLVLY